MEVLSGLVVLLRDNPAASSGFIAGIVGSILTNIVMWRWQVVRRKTSNGSRGS